MSQAVYAEMVKCSNALMRYLTCMVVLMVVLVGCGKFRRAVGISGDLDKNRDALAEESRALTTGALDAVTLAPTNPPTDLARKFLVRDQAIEGVPLQRYDVPAILAGIQTDVEGLERRLTGLDQLLNDRVDLTRKLEIANAQLIEMGRLYEAEKTKSFWKRFRNWGVGTFGTLGFIAFLIFAPGIAIPILTRIVGALVTALPKLAGWLGVVSTKAVDGIVKGVQVAREQMNKSGATKAKETLDSNLALATNQAHKDLVKARKAVLTEKGEIPKP